MCITLVIYPESYQDARTAKHKLAVNGYIQLTHPHRYFPTSVTFYLNIVLNLSPLNLTNKTSSHVICFLMAHFRKPGHNTASQVVGYRIFTVIIFLVLVRLPAVLSSIAASACYFRSLLRPDRPLVQTVFLAYRCWEFWLWK